MALPVSVLVQLRFQPVDATSNL